MYGTCSNYYIAEGKYTNEEIHKKIEIFKSHNAAKQHRTDSVASFNVNLSPFLSADALKFLENFSTPEYPPVPQAIDEPEDDEYTYELNSKVYYVCNDLFDEWTELPLISGREIQISKHIVKYFTGDLEAEVSRSPWFPGRERNYLRAIIARISGSTHISPEGTYTITTEMKKKSFNVIRKEETNPKKMEDLFELNTWVHHEPLIYDHGGIKPLCEKSMQEVVVEEIEIAKPAGKGPAKADASKGKDAGKNKADAVDKKEGDDKMSCVPKDVCLFRSCSNDTYLLDREPWTISHTSFLDSLKAIVLIKSNIWHGAFAFASGVITDNIYFGWGLKNINQQYFQIAGFQNEYHDDSQEFVDPTPEEEKVRLLIISFIR